VQPADLVNRALDCLGVQSSIGDLQEGTREADVALRHYGACMRQLARSAHWNCLRKRAVLTLLQDASGQIPQQQISAGQQQTVGFGTIGMRPWVYEYAWPVDCVKVRYLPATWPTPADVPPGNISLPPNPLFSGENIASPFIRSRPAPFLVTNDAIPNLTGAITDWSQQPTTSQTMGQGVTSQTVILTNQRCAELVYTALVPYPDQWDSLFQQAFVALLATYLAAPLVQDRKAAIAVRDEQIKIAKMALDQARVADGNEGVTSVDHIPDWMRIRNQGIGRGGYGGEYNGPGTLYGGWDCCGFGDGSYY
jgi:hypothetical protein